MLSQWDVHERKCSEGQLQFKYDFVGPQRRGYYEVQVMTQLLEYTQEGGRLISS